MLDKPLQTSGLLCEGGAVASMPRLHYVTTELPVSSFDSCSPISMFGRVRVVGWKGSVVRRRSTFGYSPAWPSNSLRTGISKTWYVYAGDLVLQQFAGDHEFRVCLEVMTHFSGHFDLFSCVSLSSGLQAKLLGVLRAWEKCGRTGEAWATAINLVEESVQLTVTEHYGQPVDFSAFVPGP